MLHFYQLFYTQMMYFRSYKQV